LYAVERKLLEAVDKEWQRWVELDPPQPMSPMLLKLLVEAHGRISARLARTSGGTVPIDPSDTQSMRQLAIQLQQDLFEVQEILRQGEMLS
jgi:hypothetical protein